MSLGFGKQWQRGNGPIGVCGDTCQQHPELTRHSLDRSLVEQVRVVFKHSSKLVRLFTECQGEIEFRRTGFNFKQTEIEIMHPDILQRRLEHIEHHLKERAAPWIALYMERIDQQIKRKLLMLVCLECKVPRSAQDFPERQVSANVRPHDEGVHKETDQSLKLHPCSVCDRRSNGNAFLSRVSEEKRLKRRQQNHVRCCSLRAGDFL